MGIGLCRLTFLLNFHLFCCVFFCFKWYNFRERKEIKMMKKAFLLSLLLLLTLTSCGEDSNAPSALNPNSNNVVGTTQGQGSTPAPQEDFTIKTSENDVSVQKESYVLSKANPDSTYFDNFDNFKIDIAIPANRWFITDESLIKLTTIKIEDESILKPDAITFEYTHNSMSNVIYKVTASINREKILKTGKTKIKINVDAGGENEATLCFELDIREYGQIVVPTFDHTTVTLDKKSLTDKINNYSNVTFVDCIFNIAVMDPNNELYGSPLENQNVQNSIDLNTLEGNYTATFNYAQGYKYDINVTLQYNRDGSTKPQNDFLSFRSDISEFYKVTTESSSFGSASYLEVFADNININLTLQ